MGMRMKSAFCTIATPFFLKRKKNTCLPSFPLFSFAYLLNSYVNNFDFHIS